jgi:hypothetical protein
LIGIFLALRSSGGSNTLFVADFPKSGLVTNEYAYNNPTSPLARLSPDWEVTSGSLFAQDGSGWTGVPDRKNPGPRSATSTDSAVFRLRTRPANFENVSVSFKLKVSDFSSTPRTPAQPFDGIHVWLRYQSPYDLYFASVARRDGSVVIGKKLPPNASTTGGGAHAAGGVYFHEVHKSGHPFPLNEWQKIMVTVKNDGSRVVITMFINGHELARLVDTLQTITRSGAVGIRGDNAEFWFKDFQVSAL